MNEYDVGLHLSVPFYFALCKQVKVLRKLNKICVIITLHDLYLILCHIIKRPSLSFITTPGVYWKYDIRN